LNTSFYKEIINKLEALIKKEYYALFLVGLLIALIIIVGAFTLFSLFELVAYSKSIIRTILFFTLILLTISSISYLIILPLLKYFNVFRNRDFYYSANKVGKYFPEIKDDLINALQLVSSDNDNSLYSASLLDAAFKNVYERAKPIKFESIVDFSKAKKLSMYFLLSFVFCVLLFVFVPGLQAASNRLVNFNQEFIPPARFYFEVYPGNDEITKGENVDFVIRVKGEVPKKVFLLTREESQTSFEEHEIQKDSVGEYKFSIQQLRSSLYYYASAEDIQSEEYQIKVIDRPVIRSLDVKVISPGYSNIPLLEQKDNGNVSALVGSNVEISLLSNKELKSAHIEFEDSTKTDLKIQSNLVKGSFKIRKDNSYIIVLNDLGDNKNLQPVRYYVKGREYVVQESITAESGRRFQPDVIIKLPENKSIVIDSKVSLVGYERFVSSEDEHEKQLGLREHINSIRSHIKNLSGKNYQNLYQLESLDFVLMFMPIEPAFAYAVQSDASLFSDAFEQNIVIVSPSTLLATLRTISSIWRQEKQNKNALEIAKQSGEMLDKFAAFVDDLISVGKGLVSTKDNYDKAMNKLMEGRGNLISRSEKIKNLGAKTSKSLPPNILNRADDDDENNLIP